MIDPRRIRQGLVASLLVAGCADEPSMDGQPVDECEYPFCTLDEEGCIERIATAVGCHRGQDVLQPNVRFITAAQYLEESMREATPLTPEEERAQADYLRMQGLVGLMPEGYAQEDLGADAFRDFVAFYSPDDDEIVMISDRVSDDPGDDYSVLVHELAHAYQDAAWDINRLDETFGTTFDRVLGVRAFIEGDAVRTQNEAHMELNGIDPQDVDWGGYFGEWQDFNLESARDSETPALDVWSLFPYAFGGELAQDAFIEGGAKEIEQISERPPDSVRQVYSGYAAWPGYDVNMDAALDMQAVPVMPAGYEPLGGGHESVWSINAMLQRTAGSDSLWAAELADISADFLMAWRWNEDEVVAMWRIRSAKPGALVDALTRSGSSWVANPQADGPTRHLVSMVDGDVLLIAVTAGDARDVLADIAGWQSIEEAYPEPAMASVRVPRVLAGRIGCAPHSHRRAMP